MKKNVRVSPHKDGWSVKKDGNEKASRICDTQKEAIEIGRNQAKNEKSELIVQGKNGQIRQKDSFGNDPCPPKDKDGKYATKLVILANHQAPPCLGCYVQTI